MALCLIAGQLYPTYLWRAAALAVFVGVSFSISLVSIRQLQQLVEQLLPDRIMSKAGTGVFR
jgi:Na+/H+ antiporter NhaC